MKKRLVIINADNLKNYVTLRDSVSPFGRGGHLNTGTVFSCLDIGVNVLAADFFSNFSTLCI